METVEFLRLQTQKAGMTVKGLAQLLTASFEVETYSKKPPVNSGNYDDVNTVKGFLRQYNGGPATLHYVNNGNGFNDDSHRDGTVAYHDNLPNYYDVETSTSPLKSIGFTEMKDEIKGLYDALEMATGGMRHSKYASSHVHLTLPYDNGYNDGAVTVDTKKVYTNIALFMIKFMPLLKWLSMTNYFGARGKFNNYDTLADDELFYWFDNYFPRNDTSSFHYLTGMSRGSYMRVHRSNHLHWENRMHDQTASETQMATWVAINKAITLWAVEFARNSYQFTVSREERIKSQEAMNTYRRASYKNIDRNYINQLWAEMQGYLAKYLKLSNCLDAITFADKLVKSPVPDYLQSKNIFEHYSPFEIEKVFNTRNRQGDVVLRNNYLHAIRSMAVPIAESLADFHDNVASHLEIEKKQAVSLYQMFKRENVDIEWLGNRLVYMGD